MRNTINNQQRVIGLLRLSELQDASKRKYFAP
jgi:hypothetical protein